MEKDQENLWGNIRQFRKNLKPNRASFSHNPASFHIHQRCSSQTFICPEEQNSQFYDSNKENLWNAVNLSHKQPPKYRQEDQEVSFLPLDSHREVFSSLKSQQQGSYRKEIPVGSLESFRGSDRRSSPITQRSVISKKERNEDSVIEGNDDLLSADSSEDGELAQAQQTDLYLERRLSEQKRRIEKDLRETQEHALKLRKVIENNHPIKRAQADAEREHQEIHKYYQQIISDLNYKHERELREKEEDIKALSSFISTHDESHAGGKDRHRTIEEYEELIQAMKREFEEEITRMAQYYQKKAQQSFEEKERLRQEIRELRMQIQQMQEVQRCPTTRRENGGDSSRVELETTNKINSYGNMPPIPIPVQKKTKQGKDIRNLLEKIKYIDENGIENEVSISNRRELYKDIYNSQKDPQMLGVKPLNINHTQQKETRRDYGMAVSLERSKEEFGDSDSDYFKSIIEECENNQAPSDLISDDEDTPMMNYSIKNLNNQLRFKPKCGEEQ